MTTLDHPDAIPAGPAGEGGYPPLTVGGAYTIGKLSSSQVMALAAAAPWDSSDPVDAAVAKALRAERPDIPIPDVGPWDVDPASPQRRYSVARTRSFDMGGGETSDLVVLRGELNAVLAKVKTTRETRAVLKRNAAHNNRAGWRPLLVATAPVGPGDQVGEFTLQGFVTIGIGARQGEVLGGPSNWSRVNVWSISLRFQHWLNVAVIFTLSCTGFLIMDPLFRSSAYEGEQTGFVMGWIRFVHFGAAFLWVVIGLTRIVSAFTSRDPHLRWPVFWPLKKKQDVRNLGQVVQHYLFIKHEAPLYLGHNPLQQLAYTGLYALCAVQMGTGFALFGLYHQSNWFWALISTPCHWFGVPLVRLFHSIIMFLIWCFVIGHVYLAVRADSLERHGGISSMINGGVWLRRGAQPVDAPEIG
ncbi:MAG: Ni/Fe-hydrogenase, b-type cytochrome subunit [Bifidobacteriaceae bacterium]|jgi:Ni/Fe-hydrogenase b-type cytochrome subunit|nr:Ni/Fe-hydrogenase, b-type cytochrome subunit [Bifidobacteriaceae bacterium]